MTAFRYNYSALDREAKPSRAGLSAAPSLLERELQKNELLRRLESTYGMDINDSDAELENIETDSSLNQVLLDIVQDRTTDTELRAISARLYATQTLHRLLDISDLEESLRGCLVADKALVRQGVLYALEDHDHYDLISRIFSDEDDARLQQQIEEILQD